jgi:hypothetical protein
MVLGGIPAEPPLAKHDRLLWG